MRFNIAILLWAFAVVVHVKTTEAQMTITPQVPPVGTTLKSQLWNLSIVNGTSQEFYGQIVLTLTDVRNGRQVMTGTSKFLQFPRGVHMVFPQEVNPVLYNIISPGYGLTSASEGFLPVGLFDVCYAILRVQGDATDKVAEQCQSVTVEPLSPPQLVFPPDSGRVDVVRPVFSWLPPAPITGFALVTYNLRLVEVMGGQSGPIAIQSNVPLVTMTNSPVQSFNYPGAALPLVVGKLYAWQVVALNGTNEIGSSEVWTFRLKESSPPDGSQLPDPFFAKLSRTIQSSAVAVSSKIFFEYLNEDNDKSVSIQLHDISSSSPLDIALDSSTLSVNYGSNLRSINVDHKLTSGHTYLLELITAQKDHWYLKVEYHP
jgi:hypothetical protein